MQTDRLNIWLLAASATGLAVSICLAIFGLHQGSEILLLAVGLLFLGGAHRIAAAQQVLADRPHFPKSWKNSRPLQFVCSGAAMALMGLSGFLAR